MTKQANDPTLESLLARVQRAEHLLRLLPYVETPCARVETLHLSVEQRAAVVLLIAEGYMFGAANAHMNTDIGRDAHETLTLWAESGLL